MKRPSQLTGDEVVPAPVDPVRRASPVSRPTVPLAPTSEPKNLPPSSSSRLIDLVTGMARVGVSASALLAGEMTSRSVQVARVVLPSGVAGPLAAIERQVERRQNDARRSEDQARDDVTDAATSVLNRVIGDIVDMVDMEQLLGHVPINKVVAGIDLPEMINEIDLSGIVRAGAKGLGGETLDGARSGLMAMDQLSVRVIDKVLRRKEPRDLVISGENRERAQIVTLEAPP